MNTTQLIQHGKALANTYTEQELKGGLKSALMVGDNLERLALQYALKCKTGQKNGYKFTKEIEAEVKNKLADPLEAIGISNKSQPERDLI